MPRRRCGIINSIAQEEYIPDFEYYSEQYPNFTFNYDNYYREGYVEDGVHIPQSGKHNGNFYVTIEDIPIPNNCSSLTWGGRTDNKEKAFGPGEGNECVYLLLDSNGDEINIFGAYSMFIQNQYGHNQWINYTNRTITFNADTYSYITVCCKAVDLDNFYLIDNTNNQVLFQGKNASIK